MGWCGRRIAGLMKTKKLADKLDTLARARATAKDVAKSIQSFIDDPDLRDLDGLLADATLALRTLELASAGEPVAPIRPRKLDDATADRLGAEIADALSLKRDTEHSDRWITGWGTKTNKGLARTLRHILR